jgi:integrase
MRLMAGLPAQPEWRRFVADVTIQKALRHEDVPTTQASYIKTVPGEVIRAMSRLIQ